MQIRTDEEIVWLLNTEFNTHFREAGMDEVDLRL